MVVTLSPGGRHLAGASTCFLSSSDRTWTSPTRRLTGDLNAPWADRSATGIEKCSNELRLDEQRMMSDVEAVRARETSEHIIKNHPASCLTTLSWRRLNAPTRPLRPSNAIAPAFGEFFDYAQPDHDSDHGGARSSTRRDPSGNRTADKVRGNSRQPRTVRSHRAALGRGQAPLLGDDPRVSRRGAFAAPRTGRRSTAPTAHFDEGRCRRSCTTCRGACAVKRALERHGRCTTTCVRCSFVEAAFASRLSIESGHLLLSRQRRSSHGRQ